MQTRGNAADFFLDVLPDGFVPDILELVMSAWGRMTKPSRTTLEPRITALLRDACIREHEERFWELGLPFRIHHEQKQTDPVIGREIARTDLEFYTVSPALYIREQKPYFIFESKRLNIRYESGFATNASEYVGDEGMMCFVSGKYGRGPSFCGMLGYVMDGRIPEACEKVNEAMQRERTRLCLRPGHNIEPSRHMPGLRHNGETRHATADREFSIFHLFLPM